jgi:thiol:disulfide interchange protein DsbC
MKYWVTLACYVVFVFGSFSVSAGEKEIRESLAKSIPQLVIDKVEKSEIDGLFRVIDERGQAIYTNSDASYFLSGELYSLTSGSLVNLTEQVRQKGRMDQIAAISPEEKIVFKPEGATKAKIVVFTDIDCGYCRKLHNEVPRMNELGIEVSYLAFPRAGVGSESYNKFVSAWCADDKLVALTDAKAGRSIPSKTCPNPVAAQYELGMVLGVTGTPAILLEDGSLVPGYVPADKLAEGLGIL